MISNFTYSSPQIFVPSTNLLQSHMESKKTYSVAKLTKFLCDPEKPLDVFSVWWVACILGLWPVIVNSSGQSFQGQHTHPVRRQQVSHLRLVELLWLLSVYLGNRCQALKPHNTQPI
jgi:hypothetical protein